MLNQSSPTLHVILLSFLLLVYHFNKVASTLGQGRNIWQLSKLDPVPRDQSFLHDIFPSGFLWGSGTSAFQTEGAWNKDGKGSSIWDHFTHASAGGNQTKGTANIASDSYNRWEEDAEALEYLGVKSYSFSLSWPRLFPNGNAQGQPNSAAVEHYRRLIEALLEKNIEPIVTLYHWDLPNELQEKSGGWKNETLVGYFEDYATFCFHTFGSHVRYWITIHNPYLVAVQGYGTGVHAPGQQGGFASSLIVAHHLIKAHAKVWHIYNTNFRTSQKGKVAIVLGSHWVEPQRGQTTASNVELCQKSIEEVLGWFAHPIFGNGDYPMSLKIKYGALLPIFTPEEKLWVQKTADFFGLSFGPNNFRLGRNLVHYGQTVTPNLQRLLGWINLEYGNPMVLVAEGGWYSDADTGREDTVTIYLMKSFINHILQAIKLNGSQVFGYTAWSLVDGFEWDFRYTVRRGLFYVDFSQANRTRTPKTSAEYYKHLISVNGFPKNETTTLVKPHFPCKFQWGIADSTLQVHFFPFSPQFIDPHLYTWNLTGDGLLHPVPGVKLPTRQAQCTDYLAIQGHLRLFASTGATHYRFALNWSLILPQGDRSYVNTEALRYYRCFMTELKRLKLEAVVILYYPTHKAPNLGLPAPLHATGGWLNDSTVQAFQEYASLCYKELGNWVSYWITINEPNRLIDVYSRKDQHLAAHNLLLGHAKAWRLYERDYQSQQQALVSLALHADWVEPANPYLESHSRATERFLLFELGRFLDPLLGAGYKKMQTKVDYPEEMRTYMQERSRLMGLPESPLPTFTETEREELKGALDFIALNHFTTRLVSPLPHTKADSQQTLSPDHDCLFLSDPTWPSSGLGQAVVPWGLRKMLSWVSQRYGSAIPIIITGSGVDDQAPVDDQLRQYYIRSYLQEALKAIHLDGVNLRGFHMWTLQDRHVPKFGLFTSAQHQSKAKASIAVYREIITHSGFPNTDNMQPCRTSELKEPCSICKWMIKSKALVVFGVCFVITTITLVVLVIVVIITRKNQKQCEGRTGGMNGRRRRHGALIYWCPF